MEGETKEEGQEEVKSQEVEENKEETKEVPFDKNNIIKFMYKV